MNVKCYPESLYPTPKIVTPPPLQRSRYSYAANTLLRTVSTNAQERMKWAILDSGASSHFLLSSAPVTDKKIATDPLRIKLPNGSTIQSSHTANIALPMLPPKAREAHIVPGLASHSLVSVVKLCNAGCKVMISDISCEIISKSKQKIQCKKCTQTGLWMIPLVQKQNRTHQQNLCIKTPSNNKPITSTSPAPRQRLQSSTINHCFHHQQQHSLRPSKTINLTHSKGWCPPY